MVVNFMFPHPADVQLIIICDHSPTTSPPPPSPPAPQHICNETWGVYQSFEIRFEIGGREVCGVSPSLHPPLSPTPAPGSLSGLSPPSSCPSPPSPLCPCSPLRTRLTWSCTSTWIMTWPFSSLARQASQRSTPFGLKMEQKEYLKFY